MELEPEVEEWLTGLSPEDFATVETYIDLLAEVGPVLDEPHTTQRQERRQIAGATTAMNQCVAEGHTAEENDR